MFNVGQGSQDIGYRNEADILFDSQPSREIVFNIKDEAGQSTTAAFLVRDSQGHVYPSQAKRLAPDFGFHPQVYRVSGESMKLPKGNYSSNSPAAPNQSRRTVKFKSTIPPRNSPSR